MSDREPQSEEAKESLGRSLYWAQSKGANELGAAGIREEILDMVGRLRADERVLIPLGEPNLDAATPLKRRVKFMSFRAVRFITRRYDRLIAEEAELTAALAGRLASAEQQLESMRERLDRLDTGPNDEGGEREDGA